MTELLLAADAPDPSIPIHIVTPDTADKRLQALPPVARNWALAHRYDAESGASLLLPDGDGAISAVIFAAPSGPAPTTSFAIAALAGELPPGLYHFADPLARPELTVLAWALDRYRFDRYRRRDRRPPRLKVPSGVDLADIRRLVEGTELARDLINTPANDLGPAELDIAARTLAERHGATVETVTGEALLTGNFPLIHAVGNASDRAPHLIDLRWGDADAPKVTLVGKGVCFDTGGLDIKPSSSMALMKKDMGGAANALGLAHMIMAAGLRLRLRAIIPAVDNAVSGSAYRPGDILPSRKGLTVEIGNTDAEGRLVLADALALADEESPELLIDLATLTGAARIALGPQLPPFYTDDEGLAAEISAFADQVEDPVWRLPLWRPYEDDFKSSIADVNHVASHAFAGSIIAALFLARFVDKARSWAHFDIFAWNTSARPGHPEGGEAQAIRALYHLLASRYR